MLLWRRRNRSCWRGRCVDPPGYVDGLAEDASREEKPTTRQALVVAYRNFLESRLGRDVTKYS
jgi:hypothetical protein